MNEAQLTKLSQHYYALGQQAALSEVGLSPTDSLEKTANLKGLLEAAKKNKLRTLLAGALGGGAGFGAGGMLAERAALRAKGLKAIEEGRAAAAAASKAPQASSGVLSPYNPGPDNALLRSITGKAMTARADKAERAFDANALSLASEKAKALGLASEKAIAQDLGQAEGLQQLISSIPGRLGATGQDYLNRAILNIGKGPLASSPTGVRGTLTASPDDIFRGVATEASQEGLKRFISAIGL